MQWHTIISQKHRIYVRFFVRNNFKSLCKKHWFGLIDASHKFKTTFNSDYKITKNDPLCLTHKIIFQQQLQRVLRLNTKSWTDCAIRCHNNFTRFHPQLAIIKTFAKEIDPQIFVGQGEGVTLGNELWKYLKLLF